MSPAGTRPGGARPVDAGVGEVSGPPLLGVAGAWGEAEITLAHRFDELHQLVYRRGGLRSSNAAVEEVAKLILIRLWALRHNQPQPVTAAEHRAAFAAALTEPSLLARDPAGHDHPIWTADEPFRLAEPAVLDAASALVADTIELGSVSVADPLGTAFDALLAGRYDHTGGLGTYLTPSGIARMMADVAWPLVEASPVDGLPGFGDPFCGTGRFLVATLAALPADHPLRLAGPFGADQSAASVAKARINMLLYGVSRPLVWTVSDSVTDPHLDGLLGRIPLILTNPPFGDGQYDDPAGVALTAATLPSLGARQRIDPCLAGLARSVQLLASGGVLGIVLPDGVISTEAFERFVLDPQRRSPVSLIASVSLPTSSFALSGTVARTTAVFLRRSTAGHRVALARVGHVGYLRQAGRAALDPAGNELPSLPALLAIGLALPAGDPPTVVSASPLVVSAERDTVRSLDPARLDPGAARARQRLLAAGGIELRSLLRSAGAGRARKVTSPFISVLHVDDLGTVDWLEAASYEPTTTGLWAPPGAVIVSLLNPSRLRAAVIPTDGEAIQVSAEFGVFESTVDPFAVLGLLYSPLVRAQLRPLGTGTSSSRRRIDTGDVLSLTVPALPDEALATLAAGVRQASHAIALGRQSLRDHYTTVLGPGRKASCEVPL